MASEESEESEEKVLESYTMSQQRNSPVGYKRAYVADDIFEGLLEQLHQSVVHTGTIAQIGILGWMTNRCAQAVKQLNCRDGRLLDHILSQTANEADRLWNLMDAASELSTTQLPKDAQNRFELLPKSLLDLLLSWMAAVLFEQCRVGQREADRLAEGHSRRSKRVDPIREQLLKWVNHRRDNSNSELWNATWEALGKYCVSNQCDNPWSDCNRLQQDLSEWRGKKGLSSGKRGRPPKRK